MRIQIESTVNTGEFRKGNPVKKLFLVHLTAGTGGTHRTARRTRLGLVARRCRPGLRLSAGRRRTGLGLIAGRCRPGLRLNAGRRRTGLGLIAGRHGTGLAARRHRPGLRLIARGSTPGLRLSAGILASSLVTGVSPLILSKRSVIHHLHAPRFPRNGLSSSGKIVPACIALSN
ncbi:MAG: hypothetical protein HFI25_06380 [Lachnospiraceae bacterium]|nr:hypothetical protein [Lachnospiraceae bacterium]